MVEKKEKHNVEKVKKKKWQLKQGEGRFNAFKVSLLVSEVDEFEYHLLTHD